MKFLVLGANDVGYAVVYDLIRSPQIEQVTVADKNHKKLKAITSRLPDKKITSAVVDINKKKAVLALMKNCDAAIGCFSGKQNYELAKHALAAKVKFVDVGEDAETVSKELALHKFAQEQKISIICNVGLTPSIVSLLCLNTANSFQELYEIRIRLGHLAFNHAVNDPLRSFTITNFSQLAKATNEDSIVIRDGKIFSLPPLTEIEDIEFPRPFGKLEAFNVAHELRNIQNLLATKLKHLDYKAVNYPGYCHQTRVLKGLGLLSPKPLRIGGTKIKPKELLDQAFKNHDSPPRSDAVLLRIIISGIKQKKPVTLVWECIDFGSNIASITAAAKIKAFSASIIGQMLVRGDIKQRGSFLADTVVPIKLFLNEMSARGITFTMTERSTAPAPAARAEGVSRYRRTKN